MNGSRRIAARAMWLAPLLAGCVLRWESTPENDEYWDASGRDRPLAESPGAWSDPLPDDARARERPPPLTSESEYPAPEEDESSLPKGMYRDLIVLDPGIVDGPLAARTGADAPYSFRSQMQWLAGASRDPYEFMRSWLNDWENASEVGPAFAPVTPRPALRRLLVDAWLSASGVPSSNAVTEYGDASGYATGDAPQPPAPSDEGVPSWQYAPFRLIAIVNRVDLASNACGGYPGELRYVYAAIDPMTSRPLDVTVILEVPYPTTRTAAEWARAWRELADLPDAAYAEGLARLTREVRADADPLRARLRSNEVAFANADEPSWEMREFQLQVVDAELALAQVPLEFTPRADADPAALSAYVLEHADEIEGSGARLPDDLRAGAASIDTADFSWSVLGVSERLRRSFSVQTCNGCHGGDTEALPFRHIGPGVSLDSPARVSRYLYDPDATSDELRRRSGVLDTLTATACDTPVDSDGYASE